MEEVRTKTGEKGRLPITIKPEAYLKVVCRVLGKGIEEMIGSGKERERVRARNFFCYAGRRFTDLSVTSLAGVLGVDPTCVSRGTARVESRIERDKKLKKAIDTIVNALEK